MDYVSDSTFFAVGVDDVTVTFDGLEDAEVGNILEARWWNPDELTSGVSLSSLDLSTIAQDAVTALRRSADR